MSAIAGVWRFDHKPEAEGDCARMLAAQQIYGPHEEAQWSGGQLALGRRLYSVLPEDCYDRQPLHSADGRLTLVADVRLDNRDDLTAALGIGSMDAGRLCDAAVLLACLEFWREAALDRLVGDFAFALWDDPAQKLILARDFLGHRPLHYHRGAGFFAFASMPKGLHALPEIPREPDEQAAAEFLVLLPPNGPRCFFKDIARVEAAHVLTVTRDGMSSRRYWQPRRPSQRRLHAEYVEGLREHLDQAVRSQLRGSDGSVGANLSAGLDSGAVTATAARLLAPNGGKVVAFTAVPRQGYDGAERRNRFADEGPLAAATAAMYPNIEHVLIGSGGTSPLAGADRDFFLYERPLLNLCNGVWITAINQAAKRRRLTVMLVGTMGNLTMSYAGLEALPELLCRGRFLVFLHMALRLVANSGMRWRGVLAQTFGPFVPVWLWQWANRTFTGEKHEVTDYSAIRPDHLAESNLATLAKERDLDFTYRPASDSFAMRLWAMGRIDQGNLYAGMLAGWGVDWRDPTADKRLVEYCLSVPTEEFVANGVQRALVKDAFADRLPWAVIAEPKKGYQAADWHEGATAARHEIAMELERLAACEPAAKVLDIARMRRLVDEWPISGWEQDRVIRSYRQALLRGMSAGHFLRKASGANQ